MKMFDLKMFINIGYDFNGDLKLSKYNSSKKELRCREL